MSSKEQQITPELHSLGLDIFKTFKNLIEKAWEGESADAVPSRHRIVAEEQRFRLWAHSLGLHQEGHASLDYRVRDASVIRDYLADILGGLKDHLENLAAILLGDRPPFEQTNEPHSRDVATPSSDDSDNTSLSWDDSESSFHEINFRLDSVTERLDALYKVATKIRNPRNRPQRPTRELYKHVPEAERNEYINGQQQIEIAIITYVQRQQLVECLEPGQQAGGSVEWLFDQYASPTHWLVRRTGMANARRKQQFVYWKKHVELLSRGPMNESPVDIIERDKVAANMAVQLQHLTEKPGPVASLATSATTLAKGTGMDDLKSVISHQSRVSTVLNPKGQKLQWPRPPSHLIGNKFFTCPYCRILCPERYLSENAWRIHQIHDLQPYHCTYEDCRDPNRIYGSRQEWIDHENQHRRVWHCQTHIEEFETQPVYLQHLNDKHPQSNHSPELVAAAVGSSSKPHRDCPFCPTAFSDVEQMQKHIAYHLERLALFALPTTEEEEADRGIPGQSSDSNQVAGHRGRQDSIRLDFPEEQYEIFRNETYEQGSQKPSVSDKENFPFKGRLADIRNTARESEYDGDEESRLRSWLSEAQGYSETASDMDMASGPLKPIHLSYRDGSSNSDTAAKVASADAAAITAQKCVHAGCGKMFTDPLEKCEYHSGPPVFHEGQKGWKCCKPRVLTFDEFLNIPPCTTGTHSTNDEPLELEQKPQEYETTLANLASKYSNIPLGSKISLRENEELDKICKEVTGCKAGYDWIRTADGWRCSGGGHFLTNEQFSSMNNLVLAGMLDSQGKYEEAEAIREEERKRQEEEERKRREEEKLPPRLSAAAVRQLQEYSSIPLGGKISLRENEELDKIFKEVTRCNAGFEWLRTADGWRCSGGGHFLTNEQFDAVSRGQ